MPRISQPVNAVTMIWVLEDLTPGYELLLTIILYKRVKGNSQSFTLFQEDSSGPLCQMLVINYVNKHLDLSTEETQESTWCENILSCR